MKYHFFQHFQKPLLQTGATSSVTDLWFLNLVRHSATSFTEHLKLVLQSYQCFYHNIKPSMTYTPVQLISKKIQKDKKQRVEKF